MIKKRFRILAIALLFLTINTLLACYIQSDGFHTKVITADVITHENQTLNAKIFLPEGADSEHSRPAIIISAGGNSEYFIVETFAVELAKRGYVVAVYTPYKHGMSSIYETEDMGAGSMIEYVSALPMVAEGQIGLLGQSRGGMYLATAAAQMSEQVTSLLIIDYVPELLVQTGFRADTSIAFGLISNQYNEYLSNPQAFRTDERLQELFGTRDEIEPFISYGADSGNSLRIAMTADSLDSTYFFHSQVISQTVDFFKATLPFQAYNDCPVGLFGLLLANNLFGFIAMLLLIFGVMQAMLPLPVNVDYKIVSPSRKLYWIGIVVGAAAYIPLYMLGKRILEPTALFPQNDTNGQLIWSVFILLFYIAVIIWHDIKKPDNTLSLNALVYDTPPTTLKVVGAAVCAVGSAYLINAVRRNWFGLNITFLWSDFSVFTFRRSTAAVTYFLVFLVYFVVSGAYQIKFSYDERHPHRSNLLGVLFPTLGMVVLFLIHVSGFPIVGHALFHWGRFAFSPILYMLPLLPAIGFFTNWCFQQTKKIYLGAFVNAFLFTWLFAASNAFFYT